MIKEYITKPCIIEAQKIILDRNEIENILDWCDGWESTMRGFPSDVIYGTKEEIIDRVIEYKYLTLHTLEGDMKAPIGSYVIKGLRGEFYPCVADVFHKKYELREQG